MANILETHHTPEAIKTLSLQEKEELAAQVRQKIVDTVSKTGGHLAPSLGVVDLTIALLSLFDPLKDKIIWDVGHQAYAWKILTDRYEKFHTLRQKNGISPFPKPSESPYDHFIAGHASISISAALGKAHARDLMQEKNHVVAIIGDGALTGGVAYEALNQAGELKKKMIVILNDNNMSISPNVGSFSRFISGSLSNSWAIKIKRSIRDFLYSKPKTGRSMLTFLKKGEQSFKSFTTPGSLFEAFDFNYIGPVDGNNIEQVIRHIEIAKSALNLNQPVLLHLKTVKGKGYQPAEFDPSSFHSTGVFEPETGLVSPKKASSTSSLSATDAFSEAICALAKENNMITAVTAAMIEGTGLHKFKELYPDRCIDVGICEQHAVTFAAGLASEGFSPIVAIYSTFMQRAYDQIIHDICLPKLPVIFCLDRAGLVGEDGASHHGMFDLSFLRNIPNMHILVPSGPEDMLDCLATAINLKVPVALRYPRGKTSRASSIDISKHKIIPLGEGEFFSPNNTQSTINIDTNLLPAREKAFCIITIGTVKDIAIEAANTYFNEENTNIPVFNARFVKPLPAMQLDEIAKYCSRLIIVEENTEVGGFSSAILEYYNDSNQLHNLKIHRLALPDAFIEHGTRKELHDMYNLNAQGVLDLLD